MGEEITVCVFCEKRIWKDTHGWRHERSGSMPICNSTPEPKTTITCPQCEGVPDMCNGYCEGTGQVTINHAEEWHRQNDDPTLSWKNDIPCYAPPDLDQEPHEDTPSLEDSGLSLGSYNS